MTRDEVLAMKPGRELDELIIRHIMNIPVVESVDIFSQEPFPAAWWVEDEGWYIADERDEDGLIYRPFNPSEDIAAAWEVVERMTSLFWEMNLDTGSKSNTTKVEFYRTFDQEFHVVVANTATEAISKAALLAVMDGEDENND